MKAIWKEGSSSEPAALLIVQFTSLNALLEGISSEELPSKCRLCVAGMLRKVNLEMTVLDYDRIGGSDPIGKVLLGYNRKKLEKKHWAEMVDNPRRPVIHWHVLQVSTYYIKKTHDFVWLLLTMNEA